MEVIKKPEFIAIINKTPEGAKCLSHLKIIKDKDKVFDGNEHPDLHDVECIEPEFKLSVDDAANVFKLVLPQKTKEIGANAFKGIVMDTIVWPAACSEIPEGAFMGADIGKILNTDHITAIGLAAFQDCQIKSFHIPDGVEEIPAHCFEDSTIQNISGCRNVKTIGISAFRSCHFLSSFAIPKCVTEIPACCFFNCHAMTSITGLEQVHSVGFAAFETCRMLKTIPALKKVIVIHTHAFFDSGLESLDLSNSVCAYIGDEAFAYTSITEVKKGYFPCDIHKMAFFRTPFTEKESC